MNMMGFLPNGSGWSPDGGPFWKKGDFVYWSDGDITDLRDGGVFRTMPGGYEHAEDYSKLHSSKVIEKLELNKKALQDANRYRWLRSKFAEGEETYIGEWITSEDDLDKYIDEKMVGE